MLLVKKLFLGLPLFFRNQLSHRSRLTTVGYHQTSSSIRMVSVLDMLVQIPRHQHFFQPSFHLFDRVETSVVIQTSTDFHRRTFGGSIQLLYAEHLVSPRLLLHVSLTLSAIHVSIKFSPPEMALVMALTTFDKWTTLILLLSWCKPNLLINYFRNSHVTWWQSRFGKGVWRKISSNSYFS